MRQYELDAVIQTLGNRSYLGVFELKYTYDNIPSRFFCKRIMRHAEKLRDYLGE